MTENPPDPTPAPPAAEPPKPDPPKKEEPKPEPQKDELLSLLEHDLIEKLKDRVNLEDYAEYDQRTRIKLFRSLDKSLPPAKTKAQEEAKPKGDVVDPTAPPAPVKTSTYQTNLQRNNLRDYNHDVRQRTSVHNITSRIRGGKTGNLNNQ